MDAQRSPKLPADATSTRSPGETRLATADSIAAVPEPVNRSTSSRVAKARARRSSVSRSSALKSGLRWCRTGSDAAAATSGGTGVGPGVIRYRLPVTGSAVQAAAEDLLHLAGV